jgi:hypothetical protein
MSSLTAAEYTLIATDFAQRYATGYIGVGDGTTEEDDAHTDLQGTNTVRRPVDSYEVVGSIVTFWATFEAGVGTFTWNEAGLFAEQTGGHMALRQVVDDIGTKGAAQGWTYALRVDVAPAV